MNTPQNLASAPPVDLRCITADKSACHIIPEKQTDIVIDYERSGRKRMKQAFQKIIAQQKFFSLHGAPPFFYVTTFSAPNKNESGA
jgi:hypothetical protein